MFELHPMLAESTQTEVKIDTRAIPFHVEIFHHALVVENLGY